MEALELKVRKFQRLDARPIPLSWETALHLSLSDIFQFLPSEDQKILAYFRTFMAELGPLANASYHNPKILPGVYKDHPISITLLSLKNSERSETVLRLSAIMVCAALDPANSIGNGRKKLTKFAEKIRGVIADVNSPMKLRFSEARSIPEIVEIMESGLVNSEPEFKDEFGKLWSSWLGNVITRWMRGNAAILRLGLESTWLLPDLDAPALPVLASDLADPDDATEVTNFLVEGTPAQDQEPSARARYSRAKIGLMIRTSEGDLLANPDQQLPEPMIVRYTGATIAAAESALRSNSLRRAEPFTALAFVIATGIREIELGDVVWGDKGCGSKLVMDLSRSLLYRPICRPPNATNAAKIPEGWLEATSDYFGFPVPPKLYTMLKELAGGAMPNDGQTVFGLRAAAMIPPYQLREVIKGLMPEAAIGAGRFRQVMASKLAHQFGPEIPQIIMADTFSLSAAPAYYGSISEDQVYCFVSNIQKQWFGEESAPALLSNKYIGSRLTLNDEGARKWPSSLQKNRNSIVRSKYSTELTKLFEHRNRLAAALVSATGHRPTNQIGLIDLDQVIPEYGLIILQDKQSDVLRSTRIAATGKLWLCDFRSYLDRLVHIVNSEPDSFLGKQALAILRSEAPIFSLPNEDGEIEALNVATLRATMPVEIQSNDNFYRHRLNQYLQARGMDPELRHAQMGWVVSPANALADLSPIAATDLGRLIGPSIDELLIKDGWYSRTKRVACWNWQGVPFREIKDWDSVVKAHEADHKKNIQTLIDKLREERKEIAKKVMPRLIAAFALYFRNLRICPKNFELLVAPGYENQPKQEILSEHHALICDRVRHGDNNPVDSSEAVVTRDLLYQVIKKARNKGLVMGPLPSRIYLNPKNQPSPFPPGLGLAVRQADVFKAIFLKHAGENKADERSVLAVLSVLAFSPYRNIRIAKAAVQSVNRVERCHKSDGILRVPAKIGQQEVQLVLGGIPSILLANRSVTHKTSSSPSEERISGWLAKHGKKLFENQIPENLLVPQLVSLLRMSGRLELSGPERVVILEHDVLATVPVYRSIADDDLWPVQSRIDELMLEDETLIETYEKAESKTVAIDHEIIRTKNGYGRLRNLLNPVTRSIQDKSLTDGHRGWRIKLNNELERFISDFGEHSNLGVLAGFVRRRLLDGGDNVKKLAHSTLYKELTYFGLSLLDLLGKKSLLNLKGSDFHFIYLTLLHGKPVASRAHVFENLKIFHKYLNRIHGIESITFEAIAEFAGPRVIRPDMGLLTNAEVCESLKQLHNDIDEEEQRADTNPSILRLCRLRIVMFHTLEASGIRPGSAHGLTIGDFHLMGSGQDYVHVHRTGEYGQAKTQASIGFFPLEGELWEQNRKWVIDFIVKEKELLAGQKWWIMPIFAESIGSRIRFGKSYITQRFDELFKWVSNEKKARTYWLRKNRITSKHRYAVSVDRPKAREVYRAVTYSGQAGISVALTNYISDPKIVMHHSLRESERAGREAYLQVADMRSAVLDMAWARGRSKGCGSRSQPIIDRMNLKLSIIPKERLTSPPLLKRPKQLLPVHVDAYARALQSYHSRSEAILRSGLSDIQANLLDIAARKLLTIRGKSPWPLPEIKNRSAVLMPARQLAGMESLFAILETRPSQDINLLSDAWAEQSHIHRIYSHNVILVLDNNELHDAAIRLLERFPTLKLEIVSEEGISVIKKPKSNVREFSHSVALEWMLAVFWIFSRFNSLKY